MVRLSLDHRSARLADQTCFALTFHLDQSMGDDQAPYSVAQPIKGMRYAASSKKADQHYFKISPWI